MISKKFLAPKSIRAVKFQEQKTNIWLWIAIVGLIGIIVGIVIWGSVTNWFGLITYTGNVDLTVKLSGHMTGLSKVDMNVYILDSTSDEIYTSTIRAPDYSETFLGLDPGGQQTLYVRVSSTTSTRWYTIWSGCEVTGATLSSEMIKVGNYYYLKLDNCQQTVELTIDVAPESSFELDSYNNHTWSSSSFTVSSIINQSSLSVVYDPTLYLKANDSWHYLNVTRFTTADGYTTPKFNSTTDEYVCDFPVDWLVNSEEDEVENDIILKFEGTIPANTSIQVNVTLKYKDYNFVWRTGVEYTFYITRA